VWATGGLTPRRSSLAVTPPKLAYDKRTRAGEDEGVS